MSCVQVGLVEETFICIDNSTHFPDHEGLNNTRYWPTFSIVYGTISDIFWISFSILREAEVGNEVRDSWRVSFRNWHSSSTSYIDNYPINI